MRLLALYDDSVDNHWQLLPLRGADFDPDDARRDAGQLRDGRRAACGRSIALTLRGAAQGVLFRAAEPLLLQNTSKPAFITFSLVIPTWWRSSSCPSTAKGSLQQCEGSLCIAVRHGREDSRGAGWWLTPLCAGTAVGEWHEFRVPLQTMGDLPKLEEVAFVAGRMLPGGAPSALWLDEVWLESQREPEAGEVMPSFGHDRPGGSVRAEWVRGRPGGAASMARSHGTNRHFCEYMTSELAPHNSTRSLCRVLDGDHLHGRWMQTCDPKLISRPDHFAYGRALPAVRGGTDFRICYRQSASERLRAAQALSWSWRPFACALAPVRGDLFDHWLGPRRILFLGDSLTAQSYFSLVWLLGDAIVEHVDLQEAVRNGSSHTGQPPETRFDRCKSTVGSEGGSVSIAWLQGGGSLVKIIRHGSLVQELRGVEAPWDHWVATADVVRHVTNTQPAKLASRSLPS